MIHGARITRQGGEHFSVGREEIARNEKYRQKDSRKPNYPFTYEDIGFHADHLHYAGNRGPHAANGRSDAVGGGHAHAGLLCYQEPAPPEQYRGGLLIGNIHGQRVNLDIPKREGSGFVAQHGTNFINFNDTWSQTLNQRLDPDGSMFIINWYDKNQCHHNREDGHDRANGRIYKVVYNNQPRTAVNLEALSDAELVELVPSKNEWMSRHARRILQERVAASARQETAPDNAPAEWADVAKFFRAARSNSKLVTLRDQVDNATDTEARLRALWALHASSPSGSKMRAVGSRTATSGCVRGSWNSTSRTPLSSSAETTAQRNSPTARSNRSCD